MPDHTQQILLHNPAALRVEYRTDDHRLILGWSPLAGRSFDARDRNYNNRDDPFHLFDTIELPGCDRARFKYCEYDPYEPILHFEHQSLRILLLTDIAAILIQPTKPQIVDFKSHRHDRISSRSENVITVSIHDPNYNIKTSIALGPGEGSLRSTPLHASGRSHYIQAQCAAGQCLIIGAGLAEEDIPDRISRIAHTPVGAIRETVRHEVARETGYGMIDAPDFPEMETLRDLVIRGLHSMIDHSGAVRASIKEIYYLIWIRDAVFANHYQTFAGWPHRSKELCRLLLANPLHLNEPGVPTGRMFGQLIDRTYGKLEEDGVYYVIWALFNQWTSSAGAPLPTPDERTLLQEAVGWVEQRAFDKQRGLFGGHFADETPALNSRDYAWDYAIGRPAGDEHIRHQGKRIVRAYDIYLNSLMHSAYHMLAAMDSGEAALYWTTKEKALGCSLANLYADESGGLPPYGDLVDETGEIHRAHRWGPVSSVYVWALSLPNFLPLHHRDRRLAELLRQLALEPAMHWVNGICSTIAAVDPWTIGEALSLELLLRVKDDAMRDARYLPMPGAMPEKFDAPEGNLYHDIRPQAFAMGAWLGAWASLGIRRLPFGLAIRPTAAFTRVRNFAWRGKLLTIHFGPRSQNLALEINGIRHEGTLQIPEQALSNDSPQIRLIESATAMPLWIRSTVRLQSVDSSPTHITWHFEAFGLSEIVIARTRSKPNAQTANGSRLPLRLFQEDPLTVLRFEHRGNASLTLNPPAPR